MEALGRVLDAIVRARLGDRADTLTAPWRADSRTWSSWYHFVHRALTDRRAAEGGVSVPASGLFHDIAVP